MEVREVQGREGKGVSGVSEKQLSASSSPHSTKKGGRE